MRYKDIHTHRPHTHTHTHTHTVISSILHELTLAAVFLATFLADDLGADFVGDFGGTFLFFATEVLGATKKKNTILNNFVQRISLIVPGLLVDGSEGGCGLDFEPLRTNSTSEI